MRLRVSSDGQSPFSNTRAQSTPQVAFYPSPKVAIRRLWLLDPLGETDPRASVLARQMNKQQQGQSHETTAHVRCRAHARLRVRDTIQCKA